MVYYSTAIIRAYSSETKLSLYDTKTETQVDPWEAIPVAQQLRRNAAESYPNQAEAEKHNAAAKSILAKGTSPEQAMLVHYLIGYVAFYSGNYKTALQGLLKANQNNLLIQHDWPYRREVGRP
jgi:hypothetical protein